jgi:hypothetical protein
VSFQLSWLGRTALLVGDYQAARDLHERAMRMAGEHGFLPGAMYAETGLALVARRQGRFDDARRHLHNVRGWHRQVTYEPGNALILAELGFIAEQRGDAAGARSLHVDGWQIAHRLGDPRAVALALEGLAGAEALAARHDQAARLLGAAAATREAVGAPLPSAERGDVERIEAAVRAALGEGRFAAHFAEGGVLSADQRLALVGN